MRLSEVESVQLAEGSDQLGVALQNFVKHFTVINMLPTLLVVAVGGRRRSIVEELGLFDSFEVDLSSNPILRLTL